MGKITTPKYRVEVKGNFNHMGLAHTVTAWRGKISEKNLKSIGRA